MQSITQGQGRSELNIANMMNLSLLTIRHGNKGIMWKRNIRRQ